MDKKSATRYRRRSSSSFGTGRFLQVPLVVARSLGQRAADWVLHRQERFLHSRSTDALNLDEMQQIHDELQRAAQSHSSPRLRPPAHLRPRPLHAVHRVYVPRRNLPKRRTSVLKKKTHYQTPKRGRPVPVAPDMLKCLSLSRNSVPEYLYFSNEVNLTRSTIPKSLYSSTSKASTHEYLRFTYDVNTTDSHNSSNSSANVNPTGASSLSSNAVSFAPDAECDAESAASHSESRRSSFDSEDRSFFVSSDKLSPKLLEVVASLRSKASTSAGITEIKENNLDKVTPLKRFGFNNISTFGNSSTRRSYQNVCEWSRERDTLPSRRSCRDLVTKKSLTSSSSRRQSLPSDSDNEVNDNLMGTYRKSYRKCIVRQVESSTSNEENLYDAIEHVYDVIPDSGYSTVVESSRESVTSCSVDENESLGDQKISKIFQPSDAYCSVSEVSRSLSDIDEGSQETKFSLQLTNLSICDTEDNLKWRTKSAEELSACHVSLPASLVSSGSKLPCGPQKSFLHGMGKHLSSVPAKRLLPPLPNSAVFPASIISPSVRTENKTFSSSTSCYFDTSDESTQADIVTSASGTSIAPTSPVASISSTSSQTISVSSGETKLVSTSTSLPDSTSLLHDSAPSLATRSALKSPTDSTSSQSGSFLASLCLVSPDIPEDLDEPNANGSSVFYVPAPVPEFESASALSGRNLGLREGLNLSSVNCFSASPVPAVSSGVYLV